MSRDRQRTATSARPWQADLAAARDHEPRYDAERGAVKLAAALAVVGTAGSIASASAASAITKGGASHGLGAKMIALLALSGAALTSDVPVSMSPPVELPATGVFGSAPRVFTPAPRERPRVVGVRAAAHPAAAPPPPRTPAAPSRGSKRKPDTFGRELADVARARSLLAADPGAALSAADGPATSQALAEEREIIAIRALVSLGRMAEAKARALDFVARRPGSPFAAIARTLAAR